MKSMLLALTVAVLGLTHNALPQPEPGLTLSTTAFQDGGVIPKKYTAAAKGAAVSPRLTWTHVPNGTVSFALFVHDPDTAVNKTTTEILHWMIFNVPGGVRELPEGVPTLAQLPAGAVQGRNYTGKFGYTGPGAPAPGPDHHYTFEIFALDAKLDLGPNAKPEDVFKAMDGHILDKGVLVGRFRLP
jgi:hypothetical protein